jgi:hypothetical protein
MEENFHPFVFDRDVFQFPKSSQDEDFFEQKEYDLKYDRKLCLWKQLTSHRNIADQQ